MSSRGEHRGATVAAADRVEVYAEHLAAVIREGRETFVAVLAVAKDSPATSAQVAVNMLTASLLQAERAREIAESSKRELIIYSDLL